MVPIEPGDIPHLSTGELDLAVTAFTPERPGLRRAPLFEEHFVCVVRRGHPMIRRRLTLRQFVALPHVLISPTGQGTSVVDTRLRERGLQRRIALRIRYFLAAPLVVSTSDLVLTAPRRLAETFAEQFDLDVYEPPIDLPSFTTELLWHERYDADPAQWLRARVQDAVAPS